jgi:hypothetical protein
MCGQLVFIDSQSRVRIVHKTARQFLLRPDIDSEFAFNKEFAHTRILLACMNYLTSDEMRTLSARKRSGPKSRQELCSFTEYACTMFFQHLSFAYSTDDQMAFMLARFLSSTNVLMWITYAAAQQSNLNLLVETAKALKQYLQRRKKHQSLFGKEFMIIDAWSTDLVRLVTHFGTCLLASPFSILTFIPPLCPADWFDWTRDLLTWTISKSLGRLSLYCYRAPRSIRRPCGFQNAIRYRYGKWDNNNL